MSRIVGANAMRARPDSDAVVRVMPVDDDVLTLVAEAAVDVVYLYRIDPPGFAYVSPSVEDLLGYRPDELRAPVVSLRDIVHSEDRPFLDLVLQSRDPVQELPVRLVARDGRTVWTEHHVRVVGNVAGVPQYVHGVARDVTARREDQASVSAPHVAAVLRRVQRVLGTCRTVDDIYAGVCHAAVHLAGLAAARVEVVGAVGEVRTVARLGAPGDGVASLSVPFRRHDVVAGVVHLHARGADAFDMAVRSLLDGMVGAMSLALDALDREAERARVQAELEEREATYRVLFESARDALVVVDEHGFWDCNEAALRLFATTRAELLRRAPGDLSAPRQADGRDSGDRFVALVLRTLDGASEQRRWRFRALDGRVFDAEITANRVVVGAHPLAMVVVHDLTDQQNAERLVERELARYRTLLQAARDGIHIIDGAGRLMEANPRFYEMLGYDAAMPPSLRVGDWDPTWMPADTRNRLRTTSVFEATHRRADGTTMPVEVSAVGVCLDGQPLLFCSARDLTDRRRAEEERAALQRQLLQAQKLESVGRLAGGIAHDFNNVLTVVTGYADLLSLEAADHPELARMAQAILQAAGRATQLTRQLLTFSRRHPEEVQAVELDEFLEAEARLLSRLLGDDIDLVVTAGAAGSCVEADPGYLSQVLLNLAANARDAMPNGGRLELVTSPVPVPGGMGVRLVVRDNGDGMAPEVLDRLFEPFFTTKGVGEGTGLGLATVYTIVRQMNGTIDVTSALGRGTSVVVDLPMVAPRPAGVVPDASPTRTGESVLVVEDEPEVLSFVRLHLTSLGFQVLPAASPERALELVDSGVPVDLVVTDVLMPSMTGTQLAAEVARRREGVPVLFMSGFTSGQDQFADGIDPGTFLAKPFTGKQLGAKVRSLLDGRRRP